MKLTKEQSATAICGKALCRLKPSRETCLHIYPLGGGASYFLCTIIFAPILGAFSFAPSMYSFEISEKGAFKYETPKNFHFAIRSIYADICPYWMLKGE